MFGRRLSAELAHVDRPARLVLPEDADRPPGHGAARRGKTRAAARSGEHPVAARLDAHPAGRGDREPLARVRDGCRRLDNDERVGGRPRPRTWRDKSRHEAERKARRAPAPTGQPCLISLPHDGDIVPKGSVHRQTGISPCLKNALDPLESLARLSRASKGLTPRFSPLPTRNHPESSSNSICRSPHSSFGQFHPRHLPCRTKSHLRPSAIA